MGLEIERKFLVRDDAWRAAATDHARIAQGYLVNDETRTVRVRLRGKQGFLTIKGAQLGATRSEFEYDIPIVDAEALLAQFCGGSFVEKTRWVVPFAGFKWEVDEFSGENAGLVVAEIELPREDEAFEHPPWVGIEVTKDGRYMNASLVRNPYRNW